MKKIDLRSDTITLPTKEMLDAIDRAGQKVLKVPNTNVFRITAPFLLARGISRIVCAENLIAL